MRICRPFVVRSRGSARPAALAAALLLGLAPQATAHDWYTGRTNEQGELCCNGSDCAALAGARVRRTPGGYDVDILPGTHPMVRAEDWRQCYYGGAFCTRYSGMQTRAPVTFHFEGDPGLSPDGKVHICIDGRDLAARRIRCLFLGGLS
jgi:hypothetical protein